MSTPPILIPKCGTASPKDIALVRAAGVVVVVVKDANDVRYMDPPLFPTTRLQTVAMKIVRDIYDGKTLFTTDVKSRLAAAFMADADPAPAPAPLPPKETTT